MDFIGQSGKYQMNVIRHYYNDLEIDFPPIFVKATIERDAARPVWQNPATVGAKCQEMRFVIALQMGEITAVKNFRYGTARVGAVASSAQLSEAQ